MTIQTLRSPPLRAPPAAGRRRPPMIERRFRHDPAEMEWVRDARCIDHDPELFFPVGSTRPALEQVARAKAVCRECPVRTDCLAWSLDTCQDAGVWGGLD